MCESVGCLSHSVVITVRYVSYLQGGKEQLKEGKKSWTRMQVKRSSWRLGLIFFHIAVVQESEVG